MRVTTTGFEENVAQADLALTMWGTVSGTVGIVSPPVTRGLSAKCAAFTSGVAGTLLRSLVASKTTGMLYLRTYVCFDSILSSATLCPILRLDISGGTHAFYAGIQGSTKLFGITSNATGADVTTYGSYSGYVANKWYRMELGLTLAADSSGSVILKMYDGDNTSPLDTVVVNGATITATITSISGLKFGNPNTGSAGNFYLDDIAVNDEDTSFGDNQTSWCGPGNVFLVAPAGTVTGQWTKGGSSPAATNWQGVDDIPGTPDDGTTFNSITDVISYDRLSFSALPSGLPAGAQIKCIDVYGRVGGTSTSTATMGFSVWDETGSKTDGPKNFISVNGWQISRTNEHLCVDLTGVSKAQLAQYNIGYTAFGGSGLAKRVSAIWANVEYVPSTLVNVSRTLLSSYAYLKSVLQTKTSNHNATVGVTGGGGSGGGGSTGTAGFDAGAYQNDAFQNGTGTSSPASAAISNYESTSLMITRSFVSRYESLGATAVTKAVLSRFEALLGVKQQI
jgi:hypothetical protein